MTQPCKRQRTHDVSELGIADETGWQMQAAAAVGQLRLHCIHNQREALLAAPQLLSRSF
jgi:hypothetical protein